MVYTFIFLTLSCSHKETTGELVTAKVTYDVEFDFSDLKMLRTNLRKLENFKAEKNREEFIRVLIAYYLLKKGLDKNEITLLPHSKTLFMLTSYCAASNKAIPEQEEVFQWVKGLPKIPLLTEILDLQSEKSKVERVKLQELIWNLDNKTYYEDYPDDLKTLLRKAHPSASLILPSHTKSQIITKLIPENLDDAIDLIKGSYYNYNDFKKTIEDKRSIYTLPKKRPLSKIPETNILATTLSQGYESQKVILYNPSDKIEIFNTKSYYLKPIRNDIQPILLASVLPFEDEIQKLLEEYSLKLLGYIGSQYPSLNPTEKQLVKNNPIEAAIVFYNAVLAESNGEKFFPNSGTNGASDSFRHFVWAGLLTRDIGEEGAQKYLDAHELNPNQSIKEKEMDDFNNKRGIQATKDLLKKGRFKNSELYEKAINELKDGNLRILNNGKN